jgi:uncharacterized protein
MKKTRHFNGGNIQSKMWFDENERLHRNNGPAVIYYHDDLQHNKDYECWYKHGELHRKDGPAYISYMKHRDALYIERYYINGKSISKTDFKKIINRKEVIDTIIEEK